MKRTKFLASLITIPAVGMSIIPLASCQNPIEQITLNFSGSDGVTLSGKTTIKVNKGKTWKELTKEGVIPEAQYSEGCESYGWYLIENGKYIKITDDYVPTDNTTAWYIAVDYVKDKITVKINYIPEDGTYWEKNLDFVKNGSFSLFKQYYHIPDTPELEGHTFVQWQRAGNPIYDDWEFYDSEFPEKNSFTITAKFVKNDYTFNLSVNDPNRGSVNVETYSCPYKTKFYDLVNEGKIKAEAKDGFTFIKWVDEYDNEVTQDYQILDNCSLTAIFEPKEEVQISFLKTEGVTFLKDGVETETINPIGVQKGTKWNDFKESNKIDVKLDADYFELGWYAVYEDGTYEYINEEEGTYEIKGPFTAKYVAYKNENLVPISLKIDPDAEALTLYFGKERTFQEFREYYSIPKTPTKDGYTFDAWYAKTSSTAEEEKITDEEEWKFPEQDETVQIYTKFIPKKSTITIKTPQHGSVDTKTITVNNGTTLQVAVKDVKLTPDAEYEFDRWVDTSGNEVKGYYPITTDLTIEPIFVSRKIYIYEVANTTREYYEFASREALLDLDYIKTNQYSTGSSYWNKSFNNSSLTFQTKDKSNDFKFLYETLKISVPVKPGTVTTKIKAKINWHIWSNGHLFGSEGDTSIQLFNLKSENDHPDFFTNYTSEYTKDQDERCFYHQNPHFQSGSFSSWEEDRNFETIIEFTDTNEGTSTKYVDHYLGVSFLIDVTKYADVSFKMNVSFERVE